jgi:conjugative transfer pilus assembly protein TraH
MKRLFNKFTASLLALVLLSSTTTSHAGLQDALDGMFLSNGTAATAFENQSRGGFVGGRLGMRTPIRNINLVAFDPPRFSAGCGGIDMFGGSFSFINADQIVALFRQIAANSIGLAFKAAIAAINPQLDTLMTNFQSMVQSLNENMKNTCAVANQIVKTFSDPSARKKAAEDIAAAGETAAGSFTDMMAGITQMFTSPGTTEKTATADGTCDVCGNPVWKALADSNAGQMLGNPDTGQTDAASDNEMIMSLIGTVVMNKAAGTEQNPDGSPKIDVGAMFSPSLTLYDLRDGNTAGKDVKILRCKDGKDRNKCTDVGTESFSFVGTLGLTNQMLFGDKDGTVDTASYASSIVGKLTSCETNKCGFTASQTAFISAVSSPVLSLIKQVQASPGAVDQLARQLAPVIADELAVRFGDAALRAVRSTYDGVKVPKPEFVPDAVKERASELAALRKSAEGNQDCVLKAKEMVKAIVENNPAVYAKAAG